MTHPTTEQSIRERLARRLASNRLPAINLSAEAREDLIQQFLYHAQSDVDAILSELEKPSEGMIDMGQARTFTRATVLKIWQAMLRHIIDGGN